jgi:hypothetical protein
MNNPFESKSAVRLNVFSHPNHEFALFGMEQRLKPHFVYLTDGGGENRVQQTFDGLRGMGLLQQAHFLNHPERVFYDRLLEVDTAFFVGVAEQLRQIIDQIKPDIFFLMPLSFTTQSMMSRYRLSARHFAIAQTSLLCMKSRWCINDTGVTGTKFHMSAKRTATSTDCPPVLFLHCLPPRYSRQPPMHATRKLTVQPPVP